ncbi:sigma-70 family RNA polymerase sigma factor [Streptomyces cinnamoneus]|uniref:sigma-70 family RNA polymerase sigma factor n=1 Tax=Streptomyces cinnamoneus TaxID=53446 RepID=UPI003433C2AE
MTETHVTGMVEAAQAGDAAAREELVAACLPLIYNIVGRALNGHADVDDVVQETMIRMVSGLDGLRDPGRFRSWLVAIAVNQIRRHWRTERHDAPVTGLQEADDVHDPDADFVGLTIVRLSLEGQRREAAEATRWLDEDERAVLSLWWLEAAGEITRAEVAEALELSPQHTAVRVQRIKGQLETARAVVRALSAAPQCRDLAEVLAPWDGVPSPLWRKRIARHARGCPECGGHRSALVPAEGLLAGLGLVPVAAALADRVTAALRTAPTACDASQPTDAGADAATDTGTGTDTGTEGDAPPGPDGQPDPALNPGTDPGTGAGAGSSGRARTVARPVVTGAVLAAVVGGILAGCDYVTTAPGDAGPHEVSAPARTAAATPARSSSAGPSRPAPAQPVRGDDTLPADRSSAAGRGAVRTAEPATTTPPPSPASPAPTTPSAAPRPTRPAGEPREPVEGIEREAVRLVNVERERRGCCPLRRSAEMTAAARAHSTPPGQYAGADRRGFSGVTTVGGRPSAAAVVSAWMRTPGDRQAVLDCSRTEFGVRVDVTAGAGGLHWEQAFTIR